MVTECKLVKGYAREREHRRSALEFHFLHCRSAQFAISLCLRYMQVIRLYELRPLRHCRVHKTTGNERTRENARIRERPGSRRVALTGFDHDPSD